MATSAEFQAKVAEAVRVAASQPSAEWSVNKDSAQGGTDTDGWSRGNDDTVRGWRIGRSEHSTFTTKPGETPYKTWSTRVDKVLTIGGEIWSCSSTSGATDEIGIFFRESGGPVSRELLVGESGAPFSKIIQDLDRFIALHS